MARAFCINLADNVAMMLDDASGNIEVIGPQHLRIAAREAILLGHKIAIRDIEEGKAVVKFGVSIGVASRDICAGDWVHLHNCASIFDQRSATLDVHSGAVTDTKYE